MSNRLITKKTISISIDIELNKKLDEICENTRVNKSRIVEDWIKEKISEE